MMIRRLDINDAEIEIARKVAESLSFLKQTPKEGIVISASNGSVTIDSMVMKTFVDLVANALSPSGAGKQDAELTPQEAAQQLRMSRPSVMRLIAQGKLGARQVGSHYRLSEAEVMKFKIEQATVRRKGLDNLAAFSQEFDQ
jgi:excisionase family DNA binding protein